LKSKIKLFKFMCLLFPNVLCNIWCRSAQQFWIPRKSTSKLMNRCRWWMDKWTADMKSVWYVLIKLYQKHKDMSECRKGWQGE
jgi:hypothetical protein